MGSKCCKSRTASSSNIKMQNPQPTPPPYPPQPLKKHANLVPISWSESSEESDIDLDKLDLNNLDLNSIQDLYIAGEFDKLKNSNIKNVVNEDPNGHHCLFRLIQDAAATNRRELLKFLISLVTETKSLIEKFDKNKQFFFNSFSSCDFELETCKILVGLGYDPESEIISSSKRNITIGDETYLETYHLIGWMFKQPGYEGIIRPFSELPIEAQGKQVQKIKYLP